MPPIVIGARCLIPGLEFEPQEAGEKSFFPRDKFSASWVLAGPSLVNPSITTPAAKPTKVTAPPRVDPGLTSPTRRGPGRPKKDPLSVDPSTKAKASTTAATTTKFASSSRPVSPRSIRASQRDVDLWQSWPATDNSKAQAPHTSPNRNQSQPKVSVTAAGVAPPPPDEPLMSVHVNMVPRLSFLANTLNALLMVLVAVPAVLYGVAVCSGRGANLDPGLASIPLTDLRLKELLSLDWWLAVGHLSPLTSINLVLLFNCDLLFYLLFVLTGSTWLIDPYWTFIPPLIGLFLTNHPLAVASDRSSVVMGLIWLWSARLTWSYFRREEWQFGAREDWRFTEMAKLLGPRVWPLACFFAAFLSQHLLFVGNCYPLWFTSTIKAPWSTLDTVATGTALLGILIASLSDSSLQKFKVHNEKRKAYGLAPLPILDKGLWGWSRHPNHIGEQLFWWALGLYGYRLGQPWALGGAAFNTLVMASVTVMVETKMDQGARAEAWREYCKRTPCWVGIPTRSSRS